MGETTGIAWTQRTWNPWHGCRKISSGCKNCYMFREKRQYGQDPELVLRSKTTFNAPLKWKEPALVFTCSWSDWFIEEADACRDEAWEIIRRTPHLTYQILTKRIERAADHLPPDWPLKNVWLGVSVEDQRYALTRILRLLTIQARARFISAEPLLAAVDLTVPQLRSAIAACRIDWLIIGGESGGSARAMNPEWARSLIRQCRELGVACFVKQLGTSPDLKHRHGGDPAEWPADLRVREFPSIVTSQESAATD